MDTLTLSGLQYHAKHGVYEEERTRGNTFEIDLIFKADLRNAGQNDNLSATINYEEAEAIASRVINGPPVQLIETLARKIGDELFAQFGRITALEVRVRKLDPPLPTPTKYSEIIFRWSR